MRPLPRESCILGEQSRTCWRSGARSRADTELGWLLMTTAVATRRVFLSWSHEDTATGKPAAYEYATLPGHELAVFDAASRALVGASDGAWWWLGWTVVQDGRLTPLPAETYGLLPPLPQPDAQLEPEASKPRSRS